MSRSTGWDIAWGIGGGAVAIGAVVCVVWLLFLLATGVGNLWNDLWTISPEEQSQIDQNNKEWAESPENPRFVGQKCLDDGGYPKYSAWDGRFLECMPSSGGSK